MGSAKRRIPNVRCLRGAAHRIAQHFDAKGIQRVCRCPPTGTKLNRHRGGVNLVSHQKKRKYGRPRRLKSPPQHQLRKRAEGRLNPPRSPRYFAAPPKKNNIESHRVHATVLTVFRALPNHFVLNSERFLETKCSDRKLKR
jgi:hypothetical protein